MTSDTSIAELFDQLEEERAHLRLVLEQVPGAAIPQRPAGGAWSVLENVRHLLFAEQLHLGRIGAERVEWSPLGFTPETMRELRKLPPVSADPPTLLEVLAAWDAVHAETVSRLEAAPTPRPADATDATRHALERNLKHLRAHSKAIERLARNASS